MTKPTHSYADPAITNIKYKVTITKVMDGFFPESEKAKLPYHGQVRRIVS